MNNVAVITVTWNRCKDINRVIEALSHQNFPLTYVNVIVVDNASTDGTVSFLSHRWHPEQIVDNSTTAAHEPQFKSSVSSQLHQVTNSAGFRSLTIIRNHYNHGGCGGFNTGFAYIESVFDQSEPPDYVWLVDDDVDLPPNALTNLLEVAESDPSIGLVGSRAVDINDRKTTLETTIYFDFKRGEMADTPSPKHTRYEEHCRWVATVGGTTRGQHHFTGVRDVDVVSACSLLARWSAIREVGFWDYRYFIYCDDADWCLRFGKAGYRVVCNLDAVVYHTPWFSKLNPTRLYYFQRNILWMMQKVMPTAHLQYATFRRLAAIMYDSFRTSFLRRLCHAEIIRRTAEDLMMNRGGKLDALGSKFIPVEEILDEIDALNPDGQIVVICNQSASVTWAEELRSHIAQFLISTERNLDQPKWIYLVRNDVLDLPEISSISQTNQFPKRIIYGQRLTSKIRRQLGLFLKPPTAVIVFDSSNDFPLLRCPYNVHIDHKQPTIAQIERENFGGHLNFLIKWLSTFLRCLIYSLKVRPYVSPTKYG